MKILVTGCAGFIGMHISKKLLHQGFEVFGIDNLNDYYSIKLKNDRLKIINNFKNFNFKNVDITKYDELSNVFNLFKPTKIIHLAAQAGVRYSLENPHKYINTNINGFMNILECVKNTKNKSLVYASSSSVYGVNKKIPFSEKDSVRNPISIYAVTKRSNELMAKSYSNLYGIHTTGLRFFTAYGPWGRPDMAMYIFAKNILENKEIDVYNNGNMFRDFTYIDDIVSGILSALDKNFECEIFNLGNNKVEKLMDVIRIIEKKLDKKAKINYKNIPPGDIVKTYSDIDYSFLKLGYKPLTSIDVGVPKFLDWLLKYNKVRV